MRIDTAKEIVLQIIKGRKRWGKQFSSPYTVDTLYDALVALHDEGALVDLSLKTELTKVRRQLAAANARNAKGNKGGISEDKDNTEV